MRELEQLLSLFVAAVILAGGARRVGAPYPAFLAVGGANILPGSGRQPGSRPGTRVARPLVDRPRAARADRHHSSVRQHVWRVDARRSCGALSRVDDGVLRHYGGADGA